MVADKSNIDLFDIVDEFAEQYYSGDVDIGKEAQEIIMSDEEGRMHLVDFLTEALHNYVLSKTEIENLEDSLGFETLKYLEETKNCGKWASKCLNWITTLRGMGLITETESMKTKLENEKKLNEQLKEENDKLIKENQKLAKLNKELHRVLDNFGEKGNSSTVNRL